MEVVQVVVVTLLLNESCSELVFAGGVAGASLIVFFL